MREPGPSQFFCPVLRLRAVRVVNCMMTDATLLRDYVEKRDERAFAELVRRHLDLVYAAALRRTGGQRHLAEEISQKVFCDLSRKAPALTHHPALTGWLYRSTRYAAIDAARAETRRRKLAQTLTAMPDLSPASELPADWEKLRPVIDDAMDQLESRDRELQAEGVKLCTLHSQRRQ